MPQDKRQRIYIMGHREARLCGRIRWVILIPTSCMTSDALTKVMVLPCLNELLTTGLVQFWNAPGHPIEARRLPKFEAIEEEHLHMGDKELLRHGGTSSSTRPSARLLAMLCFLTLMGTPAASKRKNEIDDEETDYSFHYMVGGIAAVTILCWQLLLGLWRTLKNAFMSYHVKKENHMQEEEEECEMEDKDSQCDLFTTSGLLAEIRTLRQTITELERQKKMLENDLAWSLNQTKQEENNTHKLRCRLRQLEDPTSSSSSSDRAALESHLRTTCPLNKEVIVTPTGDSWHTNPMCQVLKRATTKSISKKPCTFCAR